MPRTSFRDVLTDVKLGLSTLLEANPLPSHNADVTVQTLEWAVDQAESKHAFERLLKEVLLILPREPFLKHLPLARLFSHIACRAREPKLLEGFLAEISSEFALELRVYRAWVLNYYDDVSAALALLEMDVPNNQAKDWTKGWTFEVGFRLRLLGECLAQLNHPLEQWQPYFWQARGYLQGTAQGICMLTEAAHLYPRVPAEAWSLCAEAFYLLRKDTYYSAWWRYNLGMMRLHQLDFIGAERHFHELKNLVKLEGAAPFGVCAHNGFAASKRLLGDLDQALIEYQRAKNLGLTLGQSVAQNHESTELNQAEQDLENLETAWWGIGLVLRLQGRVDEALGYFLEAQRVRGKAWLHIEQAVCYVLLGDLESASKRLPITLPSNIRSRNLCMLVQAEIARAKRQDVQDVQDVRVQATLEGINYQDYSLAEEWNCFGLVLQDAQARGFLVPPAIVKAQTKVRVQANGVLQVWVDQHLVSIKAAGYPAQLLVYLLEQGGQAALGDLTEALFETRATERNKARQALWVHVKSLRRSLGWEKSIIALNGAYQLDPQAEWDYDIAQMRRLGERPRAFLAGVGSNWALETLRDFDNQEFKT